MSTGWWLLLEWLVALAAAVSIFWWRYRRYQAARPEELFPEFPERHPAKLAYLRMLDDLHEIERLPSPLARAQAIAEAQDRYFATVQARRAS